jgi:hypothetical protein
VDYDDRGLAALPKLVGGPRYSRPPVGAQPVERTPGLDDLPLVSDWTPEDQELAVQLGISVTPAADPGAAVTTAADGGTARIRQTGTAHAAAHQKGIWGGGGRLGTPAPVRRRLGGILKGRDGRTDDV